MYNTSPISASWTDQQLSSAILTHCPYMLQTRHQRQPSTMSHNTSLDGTGQLYADDGQPSDDSTSVDTPPATGKRDSADKTGSTDLQRRRSPTSGALTQGTQLIVNDLSTHLDGCISISDGPRRQESSTMVARQHTKSRRSSHRDCH